MEIGSTTALTVVTAIVPAGGIGTRLKSKTRKPFVRLGSKPMLAWTLNSLERTPMVSFVVLVAHPKDLGSARRLVSRYRLRKVKAVVPGGASRMASVYCGMQALPPGTKWVAVHDAARPFAPPKMIGQVIAAGKKFGAAIAAVPVVPTIKEASGPWVGKTLERQRLWEVQTPQVFRRDLLERAHAKGLKNGFVATDDSALVERLGSKVRIVTGSSRNIKVTTPADLKIAQALI